MCEVHTQQKSQTVVFLRWLAVLPAAIAGVLIGYAVSWAIYWGMLNFIGFNTREGLVSGLILEFIANAASGLLAIQFGCKTAPSHRPVVFVALVVCLAAYSFPAIKSLFSDFRGLVLIGIIGTAVGIFGACSVLDEGSQ